MFARTLALIRADQSDLAVAVVYSVAVGLLSLALPITIQGLVNAVSFGAVFQPIVVLTILVTAALLGSAVLYTLRVIVLERMQCRIFVRHGSEVLDSLLRFRIDALDGHHAPELVNRFLDVTTVQKSVSFLVVDGLTVAMQTLAGVLLLAAYHPYLLLFGIVLLMGIAIVSFALGRGAVGTSIDESRSKYEVVAWLQEVARHSVAMRSPAGTRLAVERANDLVVDYLKNRSDHFKILLRQIVGTQLLQAFAVSSLLGIGGYLVIAGELTLGQLVAAELVVSAAVSSFAKFGKSLETFYDLQAALDKLSHLTGLPLERSNGEPASTLIGPASLTATNVAFDYPLQRAVLRDISFHAAAGSIVALHGRGAAGKSTLLDLAFGLREPSSGRLELDGVSFSHLQLTELRRDVMLLRGIEIVPGSVSDNVTMGAPHETNAVRAALAKAGILDIVNALPNGLETELSSSGRPLAPSQALRLTFARAILRQPRLLLVDEVLDGIDDLNVNGALVRTLFDKNAPWTLVLTTEREELWQFCDRVYLLAGGELQEQAVASLTPR